MVVKEWKPEERNAFVEPIARAAALAVSELSQVPGLA